MLDFLIKLIELNAGEIGTAVVMFIIGLLKRGFDKNKIKRKLKDHGVNSEQLKGIL